MINAQCAFAALLLATIASAPAGADPVENLTTFTSGTPALASEVNGNFTEVADSVNDNDSRIVQLEAELASLQAQISNLVALNDYLSLETVNGKPAVRVTAANLQVVNGLGVTESADGTGNLLIGYDEERISLSFQCSLGTDPNAGTPVTNETECITAGGNWAVNHKSGSHYLVVGPQHNYSRWSGIVVGQSNTSNFDFASVSAGLRNTASGRYSSITAGRDNKASGAESSVSGGQFNRASAISSTVSGGQQNTASGVVSTTSGGQQRAATGFADWSAGSLSENF